MSYCDQEYRDFAGLFNRPADGDDDEELRGETPEQKEERLKIEAEEAKDEAARSWDLFVYTLAEGSFTKLEQILKTNYRLALWFKSVEMNNKKKAQFYDWGRYNIAEYANQK